MKTGKYSKDKVREGLLLLLIMLLVAGVSIWNGYRKEGFHVDEIYSYGLSNSNYMPFPQEGDSGAYSINDFMQEYGAGNNIGDLLRNFWKDFQILKEADFQFRQTDLYEKYREAQYNNNQPWVQTTWLPGEYYKNYLTVEEGTGFNYVSVYYNQRADVHPPFYYILLHTVCSLFTGSFSKWHGFSVNFVALMATLLLLYRMVRQYISKSWVAYATVLVYGLSMGFQSNMVFFRMYGVITLLTMALCYFHLYLQKNNWELKRKQKLTLIILVVLGYYTLYYYVVYAALMMAAALVIMCKSGQIKKSWTYIRQYIYAAVIGVVIWPFSLKHFFSDYRGDDFREAISSVENYWNLIVQMFRELAKTCMGGQAVVLLILLLLACVTAAVVVFQKKHRDLDWLIFLPPLFYFFFVAVSTPMVHNRYIMCIMPFVFLAIMLTIDFYGRLLCRNEKLRTVGCALMVMVIFLLSNCFMYKPEHLTDDGQLTVEVPENTVCVYMIPETSWQAYAKDSYILSQCEKSVILRRSNMAFLESYEYEEGQSVMIYLSNPVDERDATLEEVKSAMGIEHLKEADSGLDGYYFKRYLFQ
ncbi:MAG: glycosyltransferase family 39 protein [Lachnospiraceae bacterium]|nr:glycosyltransferase family 39 protein [Lachnospiraceae bacterium]